MLRDFRIILPTEHGSWSLMLTPFVIGVGVAGVVGDGVSAPGIALGLIATLALFLARQPLNLWIRTRRGKARRSDEAPARAWSLLLIAVAAGAGGGLLALGRWAILWLAIPAVASLAIILVMGAALGPRQLLTELVGVVGLALAAPAGYVAAVGTLDADAWLVWGVSAVHNVISVLYVRLRIDQKHERESRPQAVAVVAAHAVSLGILIGGALAGWLPALVAIPVAALLGRALYAAWRKPPLSNVKRFGFTEMGLALVFALVVVLAFLLAR